MTLSRTAAALALVTSLSLAACAGEDDSGLEAIDEDDIASSDGKYEAWNEENNPAFVDSTFVYEVDAFPVTGRARLLPWPGDYWPAANDSINARWDGASSKSPAEKYAQAFARPNLPAAITSKLGVYGNSQPACDDDGDCSGDGSCVRPRDVEGPMTGRCVPSWWGICNGWTAAAISQPAPKKPVTRNGVTFYPGDLEALMSVVYYYAVPTKYLGERCDETGPPVDGNGRPREGACRDMNAGSLFVVVANFLGLRQVPLAEDRVYDAEVWNQPVLGYDVTNAVNGKLAEVSESKATELVSGRGGAYSWNTKAKKFYYVEMDLHYVTESSPARTSHVDELESYTETDHYQLVLEADADGRIIGGEYVGASKEAHPDFIWWITGKPYGFLPGGMTYANVKSLFDESADPTGRQELTLMKDQKVTSSSAYATVGVPAGKKLTVKMTGSGDADLYVKLGRKPTVRSYDKASTGSTSSETVTLTAGDAGGTYYVRVKPNRTSTVTVTATID
jgi:hypothetical protein